MAVITISRQLGSHGGHIARTLANELGYGYYDKAFINKVIIQYGLTRLDSLYERKIMLLELLDEDNAITIEMMNETIAGIAARGNVVILGRGGFQVLRGMKDVVNVFVKASDKARAERIAKRNDITTAQAGRLLEEDDAMRTRFVRLFYGARWADEDAYDLVVDTSHGDDDAQAEILAAVKALPEARPGDRIAAALKVDPVLAETISNAITWSAEG